MTDRTKTIGPPIFDLGGIKMWVSNCKQRICYAWPNIVHMTDCTQAHPNMGKILYTQRNVYTTITASVINVDLF
jgi:hypothetical protein